jgi:hypothetical protein
VAKPDARPVLAALASLLLCLPAWVGAAPNESLLQRLYRLVRPDAKNEMRLSDFLSKATQRSGATQMLPRVLLVNQRTGSAVEWARGRGAADPLVCADDRTLVLRRGSAVETSTIARSDAGPPSLSAPQPLAGLVVRQVFACTFSVTRSSGLDLWFESSDGAVTTLPLQGGQPVAVPEAQRAEHTRENGLALRSLQGLRADGLSATVRDGRLVLERESAAATGGSRLLPLDMLVAGEPAWVGDSDWLVVTGLQD